MQVAKQTNLNHPIGVLLHTDPEERAHITDEPWRSWEEKNKVLNKAVYVMLQSSLYNRVQNMNE